MAKARKVRNVKRARIAAAATIAKIKGIRGFQASINLMVDQIVKEILDEMNLTLMAVGKSFSPTALDEWTPKLRTSVFNRLMSGGDWGTDSPNVLAVASDMALIGSILSGSSSTVNKGRVHASFRAVKEHATCPGSLGSGRWCDFDI
jgi:hypothetical protein